MGRFPEDREAPFLIEKLLLGWEGRNFLLGWIIFSRKTMERNSIITAAIILAILAAGLGFWAGRAGYFYKSAPEDAIQEDYSPDLLAGENAIAVNDQPPGMAVAISFVTFAHDGWVVIHEDRDNKPGNILGARRFNAGERQSGSVELLRATESEKVYYAMLHSDDGDRQFALEKDLPITDPHGNIIMMRFIAASKAGE